MNPVKITPRSKEFQRFDAAIRQILAVPREVYQKRLEEWKDKPDQRGRTRKVKHPSASPAPADPPQV
jgi:hypothetical protein